MSCWVVPAIAAELWGVTVNHVLAKTRPLANSSRRMRGFASLRSGCPTSSATCRVARKHRSFAVTAIGRLLWAGRLGLSSTALIRINDAAFFPWWCDTISDCVPDI